MTNELDEKLRTIPLIISPFYNPPKQVSLPSSYKPLPPSLPEPIFYSSYSNNDGHVSITADISSWHAEVGKLAESVSSYLNENENQYLKWLDENVKHYAPGYLDSSQTLLTPKHHRNTSFGNGGDGASASGASHSSSMSQLNDVFK